MTFESALSYTEGSLQQFKEILSYFKRRQALESEYATGLGKFQRPYSSKNIQSRLVQELCI